MNEACAAGTGSFLEEQAEKLGISIEGEFAELALSSRAPIRLGERCTVFMERDVNAYLQRGAAAEDLVAGLAYSIATNYLNRVVRGRKIGDTIFFQGGTAYNDAVAAAFSAILGKQIIVPPYNGVMGALGVALLARDKMRGPAPPACFRGWDLDQVDYETFEFVCKGCTNECDMQRVHDRGQRRPTGATSAPTATASRPRRQEAGDRGPRRVPADEAARRLRARRPGRRPSSGCPRM